MDLFLDYFDQFRYISGMLLIMVLFCQGILPEREHYRRRLIIGSALSLVLAMLYVPLNRILAFRSLSDSIALAPYWLVMSFVPVGFLLYCYETTLAGALFRTMMGCFVENFVTVLLRYFLVAVLLLISAVMTTIMLMTYDTLALRNERQVIKQIVRDRRSQYEFSRENIEMINRKVHDLKHQIRALEMVSDEERREKLRETRHAIDFYDAVVKTGNGALDTLLTEKSVYCQNHNIRLSCMVNTKTLEILDLVDLYTLLGNAIDNAIEGADRLSDPDKKVISLTIRAVLPVTRKKDTLSHGYGVKSIRAIAKRYEGNILIQTEGEKFSPDIMIPT